MKKISLLLVFVMLLVMLFAFSAFAATTRKVTVNDITMTTEGFVTGNNPAKPAVLFDGNKTCSGYYAWSNAEYYCKPGVGTITIVFPNNVKLSSLTLYASGNWAGVNVAVYDSLDSETPLYSAGKNVSTDDGGTGTYTYFTNKDYNCKKIVISQGASNKIIRIAEIDMQAHFHSFSTVPTVLTPATCVTNGEQAYYCECGEAEKETILATGIHNYVGVETKPATYEEDGLMTYTCSMCGDIKTEIIPMLSHNWDEGVVVEPTCTEAGYILKSCTDEGCTATEKISNDTHALGHSYDDGVVTKQPTLITEGEKTISCVRDNCEASYVVEVDKLTYDDTKVTLTIDNVIAYEETLVNADKASGYRSVLGMFDGTKTGGGQSDYSARGGWFAPTGSTVLVELDEEYYVLGVNLFAWSNYNGIKIEFLNAKEEVVQTFETWGLQCLDQTATAIPDVSNKMVKFIKITILAEKSVSGNCLVVHELEIFAHGHACDEDKAQYDVVEATCTEQGSYKKFCYTCEQEVLVETAALGHTEGTPATCAVAAVCATCGESYGDTLPHTEGTAATCTAKAICSVCEQPYGEYAAHTGGTATCKDLAICSVCEQPYGEFADHVWGEFACSIGNCVNCGAKNEGVTPEPHKYDWNIVGCPMCGTRAVLDEGSTNVSSNLGYKIYFATTLDDLSNTNYDVIRLKNNISLSSGGKITNANAIIDLGGNVLYRNGGYLGLRIVAAKGFVNGYVYKTNGGSQIMAVTSLEFMEDVTLAANSTKANNATGLLMNTAGAYLGSMKNVTICAGILSDLNSNNFDFVNVGTSGIYNHGIEATQGTIGSMENVKVSTYGQAITTAAKIGTMTNCVFSGDNMALNITTLQSEMAFVNCEIHSKNLAIYIANAVESTEEAPVSFVLDNTKIITDGAVYDISNHISGNEMFNALTSAVAIVNGQLYTSLEDAVNALNASTEEVTTFALIGDLAVDATIVVDKKVNFSFGGAAYDVPVYGTNQVTHKTVSGYTVTSSVDVVFKVVEGGNLTISGDGKLVGTENAIVADGGVVVITAGTYDGYNPREFVSTASCVVNNDGVYTIADEHDYDDDVGADKITYQVDGVCNNCGFVRGVAAVDNVYYPTLEEAIAASVASGKDVVLADNIDLADTLNINVQVTINLNGLKLSASNGTSGNGVLRVVEGGNLTIGNGTVDGKCSDPAGYHMAIWVDVGGIATINNGTFKNVGATGGNNADQYDLIYVKGGELTIKGGEFICETPQWTLNISDSEGGTIVVKGGKFQAGFNPGATETEPAGANNDFIPYDYYLNEEGVVVSCGHSYVESTCTESGYCELCGRPNKDDPAKGHTEAIDQAIAPTCTETGLTEGKHCSVCGETLVAQTEVAKLDHNYVPVENEDGSTTYTCQNGCNDSYVINNAAVNGEYFLGTDRVVFNNGVLSAMGGEFTYTYNVTTGMIETNESGLFFQVIEGTVFYRGRQPLHTHAVENLIKDVTEPTCTEKGYTTYICNTCGPLYTGNEVAAKGHRFSSQVIIPATCTEDAVLVISCGDCDAEFRSPSEETDAYIESLKPFVTIVLEKAGHKWTDATCTTPKTCSVCNATEGEALGHTPGKAVVENEVPATPTTAGSYDEVVYCVTCKVELSRKSVTVEPTCKHTNTEIIPAVLPLPSNNHTGKTEGSYCLDCETTIVEQKVITVKELTDTDEFRFRGASLTLDENISINYSVPAGKYKQLYTVFIVVGKESEPVFKYTHDTEKDRYVFNFNGLNPQLMAENIVAYVYAETEDGFVMNKKLEYSIMEYCISQLKKASSTPAYKTLISNILELGAATQKYTGYKTDALVTDLVRAQGYTLTPTTFTGVSSEYEIANPVTGDTTSGTTWKSGSLVLGAATQIKLKFITDNTEGLVVKVNVAGKNYYFNPEELEMEGDRYVVIISTLTSVQYGEVVTATFERNGVQVGSTLTYSVNAYIYNKHDTANNLNERALLKVLYEYGTYVKSYYGY